MSPKRWLCGGCHLPAEKVGAGWRHVDPEVSRANGCPYPFNEYDADNPPAWAVAASAKMTRATTLLAAVKCRGWSNSGRWCSRMTRNANRLCHQHQRLERTADAWDADEAARGGA